MSISSELLDRTTPSTAASSSAASSTAEPSEAGSSSAESSTVASATRSPATDSPSAAAAPGPASSNGGDGISGPRVIRRDGTLSAFDPDKISVAMTKAFLAVEGEGAEASTRIHRIRDELTEQVVEALSSRMLEGRALHIEDIQDQVELTLMRAGHHKVARAYVLYREERARERAARAEASEGDGRRTAPLRVREADGTEAPLDREALVASIDEACRGLTEVSVEPVLEEVERNIYDGIRREELARAPVLAARTLVEKEPGYGYVSARLLLENLRVEALDFLGLAVRDTGYAEYFPAYVRRGVELGRLDPELARFDLDRLSEALDPERDRRFQFLGMKTLYDRYFLHEDGTRFELPQAFFMRVAMGLSLREIDREQRALEFYDVLSSLRFMCSTPTLFNAGTPRPQLSSCFLTTVPDHLEGIFEAIKDNALLSKYAGGLGNDWTPVRGLGAHIHGTNGKSQGVVPFLKVANDTAVAVNQGGKRKGAACAYLETWHIDIQEFLDLRKNTGDDRRRTHDMNTAHWVPDLFMRRVRADEEWTLFSPDEVPELHDLYGSEFEEAYRKAEARADRGEIRIFERVRAVDLWRRMLTMLFETGHPWITFKDPCNLRSPQGHVGVVHSSNLCTEITLNTSETEVAVCNLGSINLPAHLEKVPGDAGSEADRPVRIDEDALARTVRTAVRMLDNVVDINFYTIPEARRSNLRHRPVGMGLMGFHDVLQRMRVPYDSEEAVEFADRSMELLSFHALSASASLARERGPYPSFDGSLWSRGVLPIDSVELLRESRADDELELDTSSRLDWSELRARIREHGIRNSNVLAVAPTATISNICGVSQSIEPAYRNLYVKSNMSGDFTVLNPLLVRDLKERGLWDEVMVSDLKYFDGSVGEIPRVPDELKRLYATAFEMDSSWLVEAAARRQKWIDQAQSLNLYLDDPSGPELDALYRLAWKRGLKTTYYLRTRAATRVEKSTLEGTDGRLNAVSCDIDEPECEACQ